MPDYDNRNRFALFKNDRKETDKHPDLSGTLNVNGVEFWISGWTRDSAKGRFISGTIKPKESLKEAADRGKYDAPTPGKQTVTSGRYEAPLSSILDDDIPF